MASKVSRDVKIVSAAFLLIFFGFGGIQQYVTVFFSDMGFIDLGFQSLILIYLFFAVSEPLSAIVVSRFGAKRCMALSTIFYSLYGFMILTREVSLVYLGSVLLGISASMLWTGAKSYVIRASDKRFYGTNAGFFGAMKSLGGGAGVFALGFVISYIMFDLSFIIFSVFPLMGFLLLFRISDLRGGKEIKRFRLIRKSFTSITLLKLSSIWFSVYFVTGLVIGIIPIQIKDTLGIYYVGILSSLFFILPVFLSYHSGRLSDIRGRLVMISASYAMLIIGFALLPMSSIPMFLVAGIIMVSLSRVIIIPAMDALSGDIATGENLEFLTAAFWMVQNIGVVSALVISQAFRSDIATIYLISVIVTLVSIAIFLPLLRKGTEKLREQIAREVG